MEALPTFKWRAVKGAAQYEFQIAADQKFASIVLGTGKGRGSQRTRNTAATLEKTVPDGTYFWRVRAISAKDRAGRWSSPRTVTKAWKAAPALEAPADDFPVVWPAQPLVLRWSPVPHATKYLVTIATDPTLAQGVAGFATKPVETQGTVFSLQGTLPSGRYYWAITPVDAGGQRGTRSRVGSFTWTWPTATSGSVVDLNDTPQVFDPLLTWNPVPGAARYELEINPDDDFSAGSRVCCKERVLGTSLSPLRVLPNNNDFAGSSGYHWRVRAFDADNNPGQWNNGPTFEKAYDNVTPTVPNVAVETVGGLDAATASPLVTWGAVPGAAEYQLQWTIFSGGACGWSNASGPVKTSALGWTPLSPTGYTGVPGGIGITQTMRPNGTVARSGQPFFPERAYPVPPVQPFIDGKTYCVRVRALSDDSFRENDSATSQVISQWAQAGGDENQPAFTYGGPPPPASDPAAASQLPAPEYLAPAGGDVARTPVLRWKPVAGARRYFVLIARDSNFTNVIDAAYTAMPTYMPNLALEDETTSYFWAVVPASQSNGSGISGGPKSYNPQSFRKLSVPPSPIGPVGAADVLTQPTFRWTAAESAQKYRIQVATDPQFGDLLDDVVTASTAYTSQTPYPADTVLYWRVRGEQGQTLQFGAERVELRWSAIGTFRRRLPAPAPAGDNPTAGTLIPAFSWSAVPGAISYDLHVDQADGVAKDFNIKTTAFAPTQFYGTGIFRYKVRANFATRAGSVSSGYFSPQAFTRVISAPTNPQLTLTKTRLTFSWNPTAAATRYLVEVSRSDSFSQLLDSVRTDNTSWAPDMTSPLYAKGGPLYWRVASVDSGGNVGAYARRDPVVKKLTVRATGKLRRGATGRASVSVRSGGKALSGVTVRVSGAGLRAQTRRTSKRGTVSFRLRPKKRGKVSISVSRAGYASKRVTMRVR
ncbi:MAG: hypothetical protein M3376_05760 [Actinomycetota bacterium]|nr:hypothetical protein [Actinomycetota bacterium]